MLILFSKRKRRVCFCEEKGWICTIMDMENAMKRFENFNIHKMDFNIYIRVLNLKNIYTNSVFIERLAGL